ncbi:hypothetical protein ASPVEDRAFT_56802 [Aspergillus versicolor CBS 583.65]|uniref:Spherulin 4-like cell surface protein n=1 Tax=Aspergillus versicolor CBS 583.65 TaxID=1036611 RepID=A0A1L9Q0Y2_ASPVE|nr:uncharacterized protein ASPVEDRAFT_56802 [Aspergillus versicolor CBS 583.65]OJJ07410.1 hypothetical protein ASPVEDRAFT_56802 [Aspergillus versicolor CBS 583.65]
MESLKHTSEGAAASPALHRKCQLRRRWWIAIGIAVAIIVILVIVLPLALILPNKGDKGKPSNVIFPLYIYPESNSTWGPLYEAISTHRDLDFVVVVNPQSGPGSTTLPDEAYQAAIRQLNTYPNAQKVGYVRTTYADRNVSEVLDDIATYSGWQSQDADLAMEGIFFDEAPHQFSDATRDYLDRISSAVKDAAGLQGERTVILNPGTIPDKGLVVPNADITVAFEQSYNHYKTNQESALKSLDEDRDSLAYIFHSVPDMSEGGLKSFVDDISHRAAYLYLTSRTANYYEHFDSGLQQFCDAVPTIETDPTLEFLVIVNPNSGPGDIPSPDANYAREVGRLNAYPNVYTIGYIRVDYCHRPLQEVNAEVARYAAWSEHYETTRLGVRGIFVDETPNLHSLARAEYLSALTRYIKESSGILSNRFVPFPPTLPDLSFVCEESYSRYRSADVQEWLALHPCDRTRAGYIISGVPMSELHGLVQELRHRSAYLFITELEENFYESFGLSWEGFMRALQAA